ncbi:Ada metal-binding domain-containing protein [Flavobacterium degerlachei]|uniref:Ada metal-binding domain-containing protein n=1 Tax=Flavobacterium degerlachei TaxID=229203 RepID=UPI000B886BA3|nr:Ada metal-binding domain-containing protein [Flavobacterium degerlachei]
MLLHDKLIDSETNTKIKQKLIVFGGNHKLKIYGTLNCKSDNLLKRENRVFFTCEAEAIQNNFRPCGHCMKSKYQQWIYSAQNQTKI